MCIYHDIETKNLPNIDMIEELTKLDQAILKEFTYSHWYSLVHYWHIMLLACFCLLSFWGFMF